MARFALRSQRGEVAGVVQDGVGLGSAFGLEFREGLLHAGQLRGEAGEGI